MNLDLSVLSPLHQTDEPLFEQPPMIQGAHILLVYSGRVFLDSDTESEGREDTTDSAAPDPPTTDAMEEGDQDESASDSPSSDMQVEDRLRRLVRRNSELSAHAIDDRVMATLVPNLQLTLPAMTKWMRRKLWNPCTLRTRNVAKRKRLLSCS